MSGTLFLIVLWTLLIGAGTVLRTVWETVRDVTVWTVRAVAGRRAERAMPCSCGGDGETCTCGTPKAPIPRPYVPSWAKDGAQ